jgi:hypothetical protein
MYNLDSGNTDLPRSDWPHHATVTMKIDIRKMNSDGSLGHHIIGNEILKKYNMTNKAQVCISGATEAECIKNVKEMLEKLNG